MVVLYVAAVYHTRHLCRRAQGSALASPARRCLLPARPDGSGTLCAFLGLLSDGARCPDVPGAACRAQRHSLLLFRSDRQIHRSFCPRYARQPLLHLRLADDAGESLEVACAPCQSLALRRWPRVALLRGHVAFYARLQLLWLAFHQRAASILQ